MSKTRANAKSQITTCPANHSRHPPIRYHSPIPYRAFSSGVNSGGYRCTLRNATASSASGISQTLAVLSELAVTMRLPSGLKAAELRVSPEV